MLDGSAGRCCNCDETPVVCGGTTQCQVTFAAGEGTKCVWVKVDGDDIPTDDRKVEFDVEGGDDNATLTIKDEQDGQPLGITHVLAMSILHVMLHILFRRDITSLCHGIAILLLHCCLLLMLLVTGNGSDLV